MRIRKGDRVVVRSGKYKGRRTEVVRALPAEGRVVLEGVNLAKRHSKPTRNIMQGGIIDKFMPVPVSSVSILCKSCGEPTRIGMVVDEQGRKLRVCRKCGGEL
ncbi:MAG: 50S ribosomal protein L24 [Actinomycetota bacterium]|jgi:large subunit ribosomal protein L24|nr:50S ribosomal protein L24 [Actinomycetota bacterium]